MVKITELITWNFNGHPIWPFYK